MKIIHGDCLKVIKKMEDNSVDAIITDPPSGIAFMGMDWDKNKGGRDKWIAWMEEIAIEALRVIKPGGHCLVWTLPRTSHWTAMAWENAGFEIRDKLAHIFGSGFPKSLNVGFAVNKLQGNDRELVREYETHDIRNAGLMDKKGTMMVSETKGNSEWEGWGTALKPAREDWLLLRKPIEKGLTIAENCLKWGVGALDIDSCRIGDEKTGWNGLTSDRKDSIWDNSGLKDSDGKQRENDGRWPTHITHDGSDEVLAIFPETKNGGQNATSQSKDKSMFGIGAHDGVGSSNFAGDSGSAARFFYCAKPSVAEKEFGLEDFEKRQQDVQRKEGDPGGDNPRNRGVNKRHNFHPTVKPISLMKWFVNLISREGHVVLDLFCGSGTTGIAAKVLKRKFIGIEKELDFIKIAQARIDAYVEVAIEEEKQAKQNKIKKLW